MDWINTDFTVIDATLYAHDRWLGSFSSHAAAKAALNLQRTGEHSDALCESDTDLVAAIDFDER